ncbi:hypothetical protein ACFYY3_13580 [Streptomyces sp. NPDC001812]|uniref:Uncharacterized protein n=1 Tax=Streptomyces cathayae TaxID=3031124 RepID=A0ABY8K7Z4_9ACTN|nr:hypothetical protein [Streptomyces sp. HUAS 5]WGD42412.1 hypothetical protein PYS65_21005 [Streptomyces sp. HUAS 5]
MPEHDSILRVAGAAVLTVVAVACTVGLAGVLRRGRGRGRGGDVHPWQGPEPGPRSGPAPGYADPAGQELQALRAIPRQRRTDPRAEEVRLTPAEREAFAVLVRRLAGGAAGDR